MSKVKGKPFELVIISGKGGTGKTSVAASFAVLSKPVVMSDCDVDAADLHLILQPEEELYREQFYSGHKAVINPDKCTDCGACLQHCRFGAISVKDNRHFIEHLECEGCGLCVHICPEKAIDFPESHSGEWQISKIRTGHMVHAKLGVGAENSGRLVSLVRKNALKIAEENDIGMIVTDGPPGTGCPVIASITGAGMLLIVTEPTLSGQHDLERVLKLADHFKIPAAFCVNKWDINPDQTAVMEKAAEEMGAIKAGRISYDKGFTDAQIVNKAVVEIDASSADEIRDIYQKTLSIARDLGRY